MPLARLYYFRFSHGKNELAPAFLSLNFLEVLQQRQPLLPLKHPSTYWLRMYFLLALLLHLYPPLLIIIVNPY